MHPISLSHKRLAALLTWLLGIIFSLFFSIWNIYDSELDAENRIIAEAGRSAAQLAGLLSLPGYPLDHFTAQAVIDGAMEDEHIYALRVDDNDKMLAGKRRNYMWEPVPWDDELIENSVQGINTLKIDGDMAGTVSVWLSPRIYKEETALVFRKELWRFICFFALWSCIFALIFWNWGDFRRLTRFIRKNSSNENPEFLNDSKNKISFLPPEKGDAELFNAHEGLRYQRKNPDSFKVTAGMFRQTFARGPALITRLYTQGDYAGLCRLGHMIELAAPCIGAHTLLEASRNMQSCLNDPDCETRALAVEECAKILENVLMALNGKEGKKQD